MRKTRAHAFAVLAVVAFAGATPALAGSPYYDAPDAVQPAMPMAPAGPALAQPAPRRQRGEFSCSYNERRTKLERKTCGGVRS